MLGAFSISANLPVTQPRAVVPVVVGCGGCVGARRAPRGAAPRNLRHPRSAPSRSQVDEPSPSPPLSPGSLGQVPDLRGGRFVAELRKTEQPAPPGKRLGGGAEMQDHVPDV